MLTPLMMTLQLLANPVYAAKWDMVNNPENFNTATARRGDNWHPTHYKYQLNELPLDGALDPEHAPWADSYWPKQRGAMSYRWQQFSTAEQKQNLTTDEARSLFFNYHLYSVSELKSMSKEEIDKKLSPLEKYSVYVRDYNYSLVKEFWRKNGPENAYWEGYCHAWAAAAIHYAEPAPIEMPPNKEGIIVRFGSGDVKALLTANYAKKFMTNFSTMFGGGKAVRKQVGNRCGNRFQYPSTKIYNGEEVMTDYSDTDGIANTELENLVRNYQTSVKRVYKSNTAQGLAWIQQNIPAALDSSLAERARQSSMDPACLDTNAAAFHIVMANQLGLMKEGFQFDKTRDVEIWNQPAYRYESTIVGTEAPTSQSSIGTASVKVVETKLYYADDTDYGWSFYFPTLTSLFKGPNADFMSEYNRYQQLLMNQGDITEPETYPSSIIDSASYQYKLDLDYGGKIIGGDWITLDRPDFLWIMKKEGFEGDFDRLGEIYRAIQL